MESRRAKIIEGIFGMSLRFCSFASGSSGNCYLVKTDAAAMLVDAGISGIKILGCLERSRTEPSDVKALLVTHEHSDHISGVAGAMKKLPDLILHCTGETLYRMGVPAYENRSRQVLHNEKFSVGDIEVETFPLSHDAADPVGYLISSEGKSLAIITDTGVFSEDILSCVADADLMVIEANHDVEMLRNGRYPPLLKQRILSDQGHMSNVEAGEAIIRIMAMDRKPRCFLLGHLSRENNSPGLAKQTVAAMLSEMDYYSGRDLYLATIKRDKMSPIFEI